LSGLGPFLHHPVSPRYLGSTCSARNLAPLPYRIYNSVILLSCPFPRLLWKRPGSLATALSPDRFHLIQRAKRPEASELSGMGLFGRASREGTEREGRRDPSHPTSFTSPHSCLVRLRGSGDRSEPRPRETPRHGPHPFPPHYDRFPL